jgi:hypothetical protein
MNAPKKHHYLPVFYLKRWSGLPDGKLVEFRRPFGQLVKPRRVHPAGTGWASSLYSFDGLPPELSQAIETDFMQPKDSMASDALSLLETRSGGGAWSSRLRQAWVAFMKSLLIRMPPDIIALKDNFINDWLNVGPGQEEAYQAARSPTDPLTAAEYFATTDKTFLANHALRNLPGLTDSKFISEIIMNMHWFVVDAPVGYELLTSDRPLRMSPLKLDDAWAALPIGPTRVFWAVKHPRWEDHIRRNQRSDWVRAQNESVLRQASALAVGKTDVSLRFVQKHLGAEPAQSFFGRRKTAQS